MSKRAYTKIHLSWLDDIKIASKSDADWKEFVLDYIENNTQYERDVHPVRKEFEKNRKKITKMIYKNNKRICSFCGSKKHLEIDHIIPIIKGGTNDLDNLQILCRSCNRSKGSKIL